MATGGDSAIPPACDGKAPQRQPRRLGRPHPVRPAPLFPGRFKTSKHTPAALVMAPPRSSKGQAASRRA